MDSTNCLDDEYLHDSEKDDTVEENEELEDVVPSSNKVYRVRVTHLTDTLNPHITFRMFDKRWLLGWKRLNLRSRNIMKNRNFGWRVNSRRSTGKLTYLLQVGLLKH